MTTASKAESYEAVVDDMRQTYGCSNEDAHEAARNLIGFCRTLMEMERERHNEQ